MPIDLLARPVVEALLKAFDRARESRLKAGARRAVAEAISELIRIDPDLGKAEAKIAVARAAGILDQDLFTAERMLRKVKKSARKPLPGRAATKRKPARRRVARRPSARKERKP
jgi:hypothetical protein